MNTVQIPADLAEEVRADLAAGGERANRWRPPTKPDGTVLVLAQQQMRPGIGQMGLVVHIPSVVDLAGETPEDWLEIQFAALAWAIIAVGKPGDRALVIDAAAKYPRGKVGTVSVAKDLRVALLPNDGTTAKWPIRQWAILPAPLPVEPSETTPESDGEPVEPPMSLLTQSASLAEERRAEAAANPDAWRVGGSPGTHGRNIYRGTECVAMAFKPADAGRIVQTMNEATDRASVNGRAEPEIPRSTAIFERGKGFAAALLEFAEKAAPFFLEDRDGAFEQVITTDQGVLPVAIAVIDMALLETLRGLVERLGIGGS